MTPVEYEPAIAASELPQTPTLDFVETAIYSSVMQLMCYDIKLLNYLEEF